MIEAALPHEGDEELAPEAQQLGLISHVVPAAELGFAYRDSRFKAAAPGEDGVSPRRA